MNEHEDDILDLVDLNLRTSEVLDHMINNLRKAQLFLEKLRLIYAKRKYEDYYKDSYKNDKIIKEIEKQYKNKFENIKQRPKKQISKSEENEFWELISFVNVNAAHSYRKKILYALQKGPQTKRQLDSSANIPDCRKVLISLMGKELIVCKTPNKKVGKIYTITKKGEELLEVMERVKEVTENGK